MAKERIQWLEKQAEAQEKSAKKVKKGKKSEKGKDENE